ncbi:hypothetical protein PUN28_013273 [Cardiocondyla obscurior]|uniref:Uncharacterized protein n=1 Tax=Cardiocondyla obscurior TaxID=286306 RepID=A0AAW2FB17_9HYME
MNKCFSELTELLQPSLYFGAECCRKLQTSAFAKPSKLTISHRLLTRVCSSISLFHCLKEIVIDTKKSRCKREKELKKKETKKIKKKKKLREACEFYYTPP